MESSGRRQLVGEDFSLINYMDPTQLTTSSFNPLVDFLTSILLFSRFENIYIYIYFKSSKEIVRYK
jgi:hypothetical protein